MSAAAPPAAQASSSDELLTKRLTYWFSLENLRKDESIRQHIDYRFSVPVDAIMQFPTITQNGYPKEKVIELSKAVPTIKYVPKTDSFMLKFDSYVVLELVGKTTILFDNVPESFLSPDIIGLLPDLTILKLLLDPSKATQNQKKDSSNNNNNNKDNSATVSNSNSNNTASINANTTTNNNNVVDAPAVAASGDEGEGKTDATEAKTGIVEDETKPEVPVQVPAEEKKVEEQVVPTGRKCRVVVKNPFLDVFKEINKQKEKLIGYGISFKTHSLNDEDINAFKMMEEEKDRRKRERELLKKYKKMGKTPNHSTQGSSKQDQGKSANSSNSNNRKIGFKNSNGAPRTNTNRTNNKTGGSTGNNNSTGTNSTNNSNNNSNTNANSRSTNSSGNRRSTNNYRNNNNNSNNNNGNNGRHGSRTAIKFDSIDDMPELDSGSGYKEKPIQYTKSNLVSYHVSFAPEEKKLLEEKISIAVEGNPSVLLPTERSLNVIVLPERRAAKSSAWNQK